MNEKYDRFLSQIIDKCLLKMKVVTRLRYKPIYLLVCLCSSFLLLSCSETTTTTTVDVNTKVTKFTIDKVSITQGDVIKLEWKAINAKNIDGRPACFLVRDFQGTGERQQVRIGCDTVKEETPASSVRYTFAAVDKDGSDSDFIQKSIVVEVVVPKLVKNSDWVPVKRKDAKGIMMAKVPVGDFKMGLYDTEHPQELKNVYWIDETEVTRESYELCVTEGGCTATADISVSAPTSEHPVVAVNWYQAAKYCEWRGGRLPTEVEWEYAARGVESLEYPWGSYQFDNETYYHDGWIFSAPNPNVPEGAVPVMTRAKSYENGASWVGAVHMYGNALEWTRSIEKPYPYISSDGREIDGVPNIVSGKVIIRGAGVQQSVDYRFGENPDVKAAEIGLRCVRTGI